MEVPLNSILETYAGFLEQIVDNRRRVEHARGREVDLDKFAEAGRVVVLERLRVAERFQQGVRVENLLLDGCVRSVGSLFGLLELGLFVKEVLLGAAEAFARPRKIGQNDLRRLCLARTGLASDDDGLVLMVYHEVLVRVLRHHEQVRLRALAVRPRALGLGKFAVALRHRRVENVEALERVHRYQNRAANADVDLLA